MPPMSKNWTEQIRERFPDWLSTESALRWMDSLKSECRPYVGDLVSGAVIARAPFGVWVDIDWGRPALLRAEDMIGADQKRIRFDEYPGFDTIINAEIISLEIDGEIGLKQVPNPESAA